MNDFYGPVKSEHPPGFLLEKLGDRRDRIRTGQSMMDRRAVTRVAAQQRGVRAVQGGDDPRLLAGGSIGAREHGGGGMGHGVMDMETSSR